MIEEHLREPLQELVTKQLTVLKAGKSTSSGDHDSHNDSNGKKKQWTKKYDKEIVAALKKFPSLYACSSCMHDGSQRRDIVASCGLCRYEIYQCSVHYQQVYSF